jgi:hypothetical protein
MNCELFQIKPGSEVHLKKIDPNYTAEHTEKKSAGKHVEKLDRKLRELTAVFKLGLEAQKHWRGFKVFELIPKSYWRPDS